MHVKQISSTQSVMEYSIQAYARFCFYGEVKSL